MACYLQRPDVQEIWDKVSTEFSSDVLGGSEIIPESNEWYVVALHAGMENEFYSVAEQMWRETDPRYACCDNLISMADKDGIYPRPAGYAQGYIKVTGAPNTAIPQNIEITFSDESFVPDGTVLGSINNDGFAVVRIKAVEPGPDSNIAPGATGAIVSTPEGIDSEVTLYGAFCGGSEAETCEEFRERYISRLQYKPSATMDWIKNKIAEWPCVTQVCERGSSCCEIDGDGDVICPDTFKLHAMFHDTFECGLAPQCVLDEINLWLNGENPGYGEGQLPFGMCGSVEPVTGSYINITIDGLACATESQRTEIKNRINDFVLKTCPSEDLQLRQIELIIAQIIGNTNDLFVTITEYNDDTLSSDGITIDNCGDVIVDCGYKICIHNIDFVNLSQNTSGCL